MLIKKFCFPCLVSFLAFLPVRCSPGNIISAPLYLVVVHEAGRYYQRSGSTLGDTVLKDMFEARWIGLQGRVKNVTFRVLSFVFFTR